ncbi:hypothetical protein AB0F24_17145 [Streptomyces platensis]|uniref:hypothetical protein n=1 Tax=Streptomyces platensis TaxID=58346 RepID=UPI0033D28A77
MDEGWAALAAGVAALVGAVAGGWYAGRAAKQGAEKAAEAVLRQVVDQGAIEHGHWLRGQRQEAYVAFLAAWDASMARIETQGELSFLIMTGKKAEPSRHSNDARVRLNEAREAAVSVYERVLILGPEPAEVTAAAMMNALRRLCSTVNEMSGPQRDAVWIHDTWSSKNRAAPGARVEFIRSVREALQAPPRPSA